MKLLTFFLICLVVCCVIFCPLPLSAAGQPDSDDLAAVSERSETAGSLLSLCQRFNALNSRIRDSRITNTAARLEVTHLLAELRDEYFRTGGREHPATSWAFPLAGYDARAIGGGRRHGYSARGYDYFNGNRHGGHPSYDIFIRDRNQDGRDDRTYQPVKVVSMTAGIVVALEEEWQPGSRLRGGKYVWVYDPAHDLLVYYAHAAELSIRLGALVRPGDVLAVVGRSGFNAAKARSPTHLHMTVVRARNGTVVPRQVFPSLQRARTISDRPPAAQKEASRSS